YIEPRHTSVPSRTRHQSKGPSCTSCRASSAIASRATCMLCGVISVPHGVALSALPSTWICGRALSTNGVAALILSIRFENTVDPLSSGGSAVGLGVGDDAPLDARPLDVGVEPFAQVFPVAPFAVRDVAVELGNLPACIKIGVAVGGAL